MLLYKWYLSTFLQNLLIERVWVEVNARVNYPIKNALREMEENNLIDMELDYVKYCVSSVALRFAYVGMHKVVQSWNNHTIPGDLHIISFPYQLIIRTYMCCCNTVHLQYWWSRFKGFKNPYYEI